MELDCEMRKQHHRGAGGRCELSEQHTGCSSLQGPLGAEGLCACTRSVHTLASVHPLPRLLSSVFLGRAPSALFAWLRVVTRPCCLVDLTGMSSSSYKKTQETLSQAGQKTSAALSTVGSAISRKLGDMR